MMHLVHPSADLYGHLFKYILKPGLELGDLILLPYSINSCTIIKATQSEVHQAFSHLYQLSCKVVPVPLLHASISIACLVSANLFPSPVFLR